MEVEVKVKVEVKVEAEMEAVRADFCLCHSGTVSRK